MKKYFYFLPVFVLLFSKCNTIDEKEGFNDNALMPQKQIVRYFSELGNDSIHKTSISAYQNNNVNIKKIVFDKVLNNEVQVFENIETNIYNLDTAPVPLIMQDIESKLGMHTQQLTYVDENGNEVNQTIKLDFVPDEISEIGFVEEWNLNVDGFKMSKNVLVYDFVREYTKDGESEIRKLLTFTIIPNIDTITNPKWDLVCTKVNEVRIEAVSLNEIIEYGKEKQEFWNAGNSIFNYRNPFWNSYTYTTLVDALFKNVEEGKVNTFDFNTKEAISFSEIEERMGATEMTINYINENGDEVTQTIKQDLIAEEIKSLIFIEDWYIESNTLALRKKITGIAPVRYFMKGETDYVFKQIPFVILYD